jgi:sugar-specific transcriptional regulator TrmB
MNHKLQELGLSAEEAKIYLSALELGGSYASNIAKKAGLNRASSYSILNRLKEKGLISTFTKGKTLWFNPETPEKFVKMQEEKLSKARDLVPLLLSITNSHAHKPKIRFYEGVNGLKNVLDDVIETKPKEVLGYTDLNATTAIIPEYFREFCHAKVKHKIKTRYLSPENPNAIEVVEKSYPKKYDSKLLEILLVNRQEFLFENDISIYENKVAIFSLDRQELMAILIESPSLARSMRSIFDLAWLGATSFIAR